MFVNNRILFYMHMSSSIDNKMALSLSIILWPCDWHVPFCHVSPFRHAVANGPSPITITLTLTSSQFNSTSFSFLLCCSLHELIFKILIFHLANNSMFSSTSTIIAVLPHVYVRTILIKLVL